MLRRLSISNYVLIDSLDVEFPESLVIMTGETGAGKSIILGAVSLLLGARADVSVLGDSSRNCVVEAEFCVRDDGDLPVLFMSNDMDFSREIIIRRVISPSGRSRAFLNDEPVNVSFLNVLSPHLIDIHSQHQHLKLADPSFLLSVVDTFAGSETVLLQYKAAFAEYNALKRQISDLKDKIAADNRDREYRLFQSQTLAAASLREGETAELEAEQKELTCAEDIRSYLSSTYSRLENDSFSLHSLLKESVRDIEKAAAQLPQYESLAGRLNSCRIELDDILSDIQNAADNVVVSQDRLERVSERLSFLWSLMAKFGCKDESELIGVRNSLQSSLQTSDDDLSRLDEMESRFADVESSVKELSHKLHDIRSGAVVSAGQKLQDLIRSLEMPKARIAFTVADSGVFGQAGSDRVTLSFASSSSVKMNDISRTASGGELSRIMLCLKSMLAVCTSMPSIVFDEIDTGVSGSVADKMGQMLSEMGKTMQVIAITHLPQVASKGSVHFKVVKSYTDDNKAQTSLVSLEKQGRIDEIARLLSGSCVTEAAIENARSLLANGR